MTADSSPNRVVLNVDKPENLLDNLRAGLRDYREGIESWRIWHIIGISEIRRRYARSRLGQVWLTLSTGLFVLMYGMLFAFLFHQPPEKMLPYVTASFILWSTIAGSIGNATTCLVGAHKYFRNQYASFSIAIFVVIYREMIVLAHEIWVIFAVLIYFGLFFHVKVFAALAGFALVFFTLTWVCYLVAIVCVRYRDVIQIMASVMRAAFFLTPVFWHEEMFPEAYRKYLILNPFNVLLSVIRDPLLGSYAPPHYLLYGTVASVIGFVISLIFIGKYRRRIVFWI
jgi:lipopolysaccharide transport system permease protein